MCQDEEMVNPEYLIRGIPVRAARGTAASLREPKACACCNVIKSAKNFQRRGKNNQSLDSWCNACKAESHDKWFENNREAFRLSALRRRINARLEVIQHYGGKCACCGEAELAFLAIDHIDGGGARHRASLGHMGRGRNFCCWLKKQGYPEGYRVLCHNCNMALGFYGVCPHQRNQLSPVGSTRGYLTDSASELMVLRNDYGADIDVARKILAARGTNKNMPDEGPSHVRGEAR